MIQRLSKRQLGILQYLAVYKYLTRVHLLRLFGLKNRSQLQDEIDFLKNRKLTACTANVVLDGQGRQPQFHYLTEKGASFVEEELGMKEPKYPKYMMLKPGLKFKHHAKTISVEIELGFYFPIVFSERYLDFIGNQKGEVKLAPKTRFVWSKDYKMLEPDIIFGTYDRLFCVEVHMGDGHNKEAIDKIDDYAQSIALGMPADLYDYKFDARVLWVFELRSCMEAVMKAVYTTGKYERMVNHFLFQTITDFNPAVWHNLKAEEITLQPSWETMYHDDSTSWILT